MKGKVDTAIVVPLRYRIRHLQNGRLAKPRELGGRVRVDRRARRTPRVRCGRRGQAGDLADRPRGGRRGPPAASRQSPARPRPGRRRTPTMPRRPRRTAPARSRTRTTGARTRRPRSRSPPASGSTRSRCSCSGEEVLALPYGDLDMSATPDRMPELYPISRERVGDVLVVLGDADLSGDRVAGRLPRPVRDRRHRRRQHAADHRPDVRSRELPQRSAPRRGVRRPHHRRDVVRRRDRRARAPSPGSGRSPSGSASSPRRQCGWCRPAGGTR